MSAALLDLPPAAPPRPAAVRCGWLVSPAIDLLFIANIGWPLLLLAQIGDGLESREGIRFWQVYFVTTPHRWITLGLVFLDRERLHGRPRLFIGLALAAVALCLGVKLTTGALTCLLTVDYIWNAWHFAAQHHGVYRIYSRRTEPERQSGLGVEKWGLRLFLLYVTIRIAGATWSRPAIDQTLRQADWGMALIPLALIGWDLSRSRSGGFPRSMYLASVCTLYLGLLAAVHLERPALVLALATASALFHALEYLTVVGWSVRQRHQRSGDRLGLLAWLAPRWGLALGLFILILGAAGWLMDQRLLETWLTINVVVAFLHYAYDGIIWRQPRGAPA